MTNRAGDLNLKPIDGKSHVKGEKTASLSRETIPSLLASTVAAFGDREAAYFVETDRRLSYTELAKEVDMLAAGFLALGLEKGDRIGIWSPNRFEWLLTQFATAR
ncbi:MAG: AMP-binding protein, partial [Sneathiellales bacterium]|nr:AMP-binding protein [Sneathiellales bacterium]